MTSQHVQQLLMQAQNYQQQIQNIITQKETLKLQEIEIKKALEELEKTNEENVYKISGPILVKTTKESITQELKDKQELIQARIKTLERNEEKIKEKIEELREKLMQQSSGG